MLAKNRDLGKGPAQARLRAIQNPAHLNYSLAIGSLRLGRQGLGRTANRLLAREFAEADIPFDELRVCHLLGDREDERTLLLRMRGTSKEDGGVGE